MGTKGDGGAARTVASKAPRKNLGGGGSSAAARAISAAGAGASPGGNKYSGGNSYNPQPTPDWQKPLTSFFKRDPNAPPPKKKIEDDELEEEKTPKDKGKGKGKGKGKRKKKMTKKSQAMKKVEVEARVNPIPQNCRKMVSFLTATKTEIPVFKCFIILYFIFRSFSSILQLLPHLKPSECLKVQTLPYSDQGLWSQLILPHLFFPLKMRFLNN